MRSNIFVWLAGLLASGFLAGISSYEFIVRSSGQTRVAVAQLEQLQDDKKTQASKIAEFTKEMQDEKKNQASKIAEFTKEISSANQRTQRAEQQLRNLHERELIVKLFGDNYWAYRAFDLKKEIGADLSFGQCGTPDCFKLRYLGTKSQSGVDSIEVAMLGPGLSETGVTVTFSASKGTQLGLQTAIVDYLLVVEDDRINSFRLGVGLREGTADPEGIPQISFNGLRDDNVPTRKQFGDFL